MSKKKIFILIIIVVLVVSYFIYWSKQNSLNNVNQITSFDVKNCTYIINNENIALENGYAEKVLSTELATKSVVRYFGNQVAADFNNDGTNDEIFILTQDNGGSGTFYYAVGAINTSGGCFGTNTILLGDRIAPQTTELKDGMAVVNYADRAENEPMTSQPSIGVSRYFQIIDGKLLEVNK
ncbi:hypothetical protein GW933_00655 [Candidatus Falkowbacteria bacterium]|uniref:Uncharacterized protein n=1 Tax=Candidatus Buchananbacteria bacterium CG10_big_fil_rev_8_21_14_0_10_33_19 TaxID=1974525 RepID=A0A2H0W342_9BACT|nr:hypothetical protein [Candidatus Falkowbacteria bacterium]PIS05766.1 MAG: hypothetical protein COT80_03280 [Candidatus Buchananbacteria bacterium CG10_big_fil_rev_8_21_14_0_10_33_19]